MDSDLKAAILDEFCDYDSVVAVAEHGCESGAGPASFIYNSQIVDFFDKWRLEIENEMGEADINYDMLAPDCNSLTIYKVKATWWIVECVCQIAVNPFQIA